MFRPSGEAQHIGRQLRRHHPDWPGLGPNRVRHYVAVEDRPLLLLQLWTGLDAQLLDQRGPALGVDRQRTRRIAEAVQGPASATAGRARAADGPELPAHQLDRVRRPIQADQDLGEILGHGRPLLLGHCAPRGQQRPARQPCQHRTTPAPQGRAEQVGSTLQIAETHRVTTGRHTVGERRQIQLVRRAAPVRGGLPAPRPATGRPVTTIALSTVSI